MRLNKLKYILPNLFTMASLFFGINSIFFSISGEFLQAGVAILFAAIMDMMDGRIARLTKTESLFGMNLDSLADSISFGVAPAFLIYFFAFNSFKTGYFNPGSLIVFIFVLCGVLRLARFNVKTLKKKKVSNFFSGIPIPAAAVIIALSIISYHQTHLFILKNPTYYIVVTLILSGLMVSSIPFPSFKKVNWSLKKKIFIVSVLLILFILFNLAPVSLILLITAYAYIISAILYNSYKKLTKFDRKKEEDSLETVDH